MLTRPLQGGLHSRLHAAFFGNSRLHAFPWRGLLHAFVSSITPSRPFFSEITPSRPKKRPITPSRRNFWPITPSRPFFRNHAFTPLSPQSRLHAHFFPKSRLHAQKKGQSRLHAFPWGGLFKCVHRAMSKMKLLCVETPESVTVTHTQDYTTGRLIQ